MRARTRSVATTLALLVAAAAAVAWAYLGVGKRGDAERERKEREERVFALEPAQVREVVVTARGETTRAVRDGERWRLAAPVDAPGERAALDALVERVAALRRTSEVAPAPGGELARFGLAKPRATVELALADGRRETLALGDENAFDGSVYARPTSGAVVAVPGDVRWALERGAFDLRDKRLLPLEEDPVRVEVKAPRLAYALERDGDGWRLAAPAAGAADPDAAARVVGALRALRATGFAPAGDPRAKALSRPRFTVAVRGKEGPGRTLAVADVPATKAAPSARVARVEGAPDLALLPADALSALDLTLAELKEKPPPPEGDAKGGDAAAAPAPPAPPPADPGRAPAAERG
jgi:hypothetical protein